MEFLNAHIYLKSAKLILKIFLAKEEIPSKRKPKPTPTSK